MEGGHDMNTGKAQPFEAYMSISIGTLNVETGIVMPHYSPDVARDSWAQAVQGLKDTIEAAASLGLVQTDNDDDEDDDDLED